VLIVLG